MVLSITDRVDVELTGDGLAAWSSLRMLVHHVQWSTRQSVGVAKLALQLAHGASYLPLRSEKLECLFPARIKQRLRRASSSRSLSRADTVACGQQAAPSCLAPVQLVLVLYRPCGIR